MTSILRTVFLACVLVLSSSLLSASEPTGHWKTSKVMEAKEAVQAAAADDNYVYAINNKVVAKYDRKTGERVSISRGEAHHLNSGFFLGKKLYCAHSNFPKTPEESEIKVLDVDSMELTTFKDFGMSSHGSLTVAIFEEGSWWCVFAQYGKKNNSRTVLVKYNKNWDEEAVFTFPESVISDLGNASISGGIWHRKKLLATGHDKTVLYELELPDQGTVLTHTNSFAVPFPGQGIAFDPVTEGLVGIHRKNRQVLFAVRIND